MAKLLKIASTYTQRVVKLAVSLAFYSLTATSLRLQRLMGREPAGTCVVLYYHAIPARHRARFARQMDVLLRCAKPIRSDVQEPLRSGIHHAAVVFHDAFVSVSDNALPELEKRAIPSTLFVPTGYLGCRQGWITSSEHSDYEEIVLDVGRLKSLNNHLVSIGSHTVNHADLSVLSDDQATEELRDSKVTLEKLLGRPVGLFAFPYGRQNDALIHLTRQLGYQRVFTIQPELAFLEPGEFVTGSCAAAPTDWALEFRLKVLGAYRWLTTTRRLRARVGRRLRRLLVLMRENGLTAQPATSSSTKKTRN